MTRLRLFRIITAALLIGWMIMIFVLSAQTAAESSMTSGGLSRELFEIFYPPFRPMTAEQQDSFIESASFAVRKLAHFFIYAFLGMFAFLAAVSYRKYSLALRDAAAWFLCVLYAVSDEIHQIFIDGRSCEVRDVLIDSCGALLGLLICTGISFWWKKTKNFVRREKRE